jgi:hypothetical protein
MTSQVTWNTSANCDIIFTWLQSFALQEPFAS